jgi:hypothetical protein
VTGRTLLSYSALTRNFPCFVIPVFSVPGKNAVCVQDLDAFGKVARFVPFEPDHFHTVPMMATPHTVDIGEAGLLGFWENEDHLVVGTAKELKAYLLTVDEEEMPVFAALEAMTLVGDERRLAKVAKRAATLIADDRARTSLKDRVLSRRIVEEKQKENQRAREEEQASLLSEALSHLEVALPAEEWVKNWRQVLTEFGNREELRGIAEWRLTTSGLEEHEGQVLVTLFARWPSPLRNPRYIYEWLRKNFKDSQNWSTIWTFSQGRFWPNDSEHHDLAIDYLEYSLNQGDETFFGWSKLSLWRRLWRYDEARERLIEIARGILSFDHHHDEYMESIASHLMRVRTDLPWLREIISAWLLTPRPTNVWVAMFIEYTRRHMEDAHEHAGFEWLQRLGRGSNQWVKLWRHMRNHLPFDLWAGMAEHWLFTARTDLKSWIVVFEEIQNARGMFATERLRDAARRWINKQSGKRHNALIRHVADMPDDKLILTAR